MNNFVVLNANELNKLNGGAVSSLISGDGGCVRIPGIPRFPRFPRILVFWFSEI